MKTLYSVLLHHVQETGDKDALGSGESSADEVRLMRRIGRAAARSHGLDELTDDDCRKLWRVAEDLFFRPTRNSRDLAEDLALQRDDLVRLYRIIKDIRPIQDALTFESPLRRRISFLRTALLSGNLPTLKAMFRGEVCLPNHIEFHPALVCNLRCRACPNCRSDSEGEWQFLGYPVLGEPLQAGQMHMIADLFLDMGIRDFSFGGGGEPSLSELTLSGITYLRNHGEAEISLYTNGIFPSTLTESRLRSLVTSLNKMRFSIDAANAQEWSRYKGRSAELFEILWKNIATAVRVKRSEGGTTRIGASCLVSDLTCNDVEGFLLRALDAGLSFCDLKAVETCFGEKEEYKARCPETRKAISALIAKVRSGAYAPMDVVVDDSLQIDEDRAPVDTAPSRCWIAVRGRMLTVGPYGELYPCSDAANPGAVERCNNKLIGQLTAFASRAALSKEFTSIWSDSLQRRQSMSRDNCSYCVPSHNNYNSAIDKLYHDWRFGIMPEDQPFAGEPDHYHVSHGS